MRRWDEAGGGGERGVGGGPRGLVVGRGQGGESLELRQGSLAPRWAGGQREKGTLCLGGAGGDSHRGQGGGQRVDAGKMQLGPSGRQLLIRSQTGCKSQYLGDFPLCSSNRCH